MNWPALAALFAFAAPLTAAIVPVAYSASGDEHRISGPVVHDNLAVYFVHGRSSPGPVPLTLGEAISAGKVTVHETGNVSQLSIENVGTDAVFVQAGDIVKGGKQDRVLTVSFLVPPNSGRMPIAAYCVERGRWTARGGEDTKRFASAEKSVPSRAAKLAISQSGMRTASLGAAPVAARTPAGRLPPTSPSDQNVVIQATPPVLPPTAGARSTIERDALRQTNRQAVLGQTGGSQQSAVWALVDSAQRKLSANVGANVAAVASATSLQLALENERLAKLRTNYTDKLAPAGTAEPDIIGYVIAINGKITSGDVYPSNGLFKKMWPKQIEAGATEAIAEKSPSIGSAPVIGQVQSFLAQAEAGNTALSNMPGNKLLVREERSTDKALFLETRQAAGSFIHRSYLARH